MFSSSRYELPEYLLDFGFVFPGASVSQTVTITNDGLVPVSFKTNCKGLAGTGNKTPAPALFTTLNTAQHRTLCVLKGFSAEFLQPMTLLCGQSQTFTAKYDANHGNPTPGRRSVLLLIKVLTDL